MWWHTENKALYCVDDGKKIPLPRFYRDKIFEKEEVKYMIEKQKKKSEEKLLKEMASLQETHHDPHGYYVARREYNHSLIKHKSNLNDKF